MSEYATGAINRPWRTDCVQHPCRDMAIRSRSPGRDRQGNAAPVGQPSPAAGDVHMQWSNIDWEGAGDDYGDDQESDRHSEQDPLSARTAQTARCGGEEQHQRAL